MKLHLGLILNEQDVECALTLFKRELTDIDKYCLPENGHRESLNKMIKQLEHFQDAGWLTQPKWMTCDDKSSY